MGILSSLGQGFSSFLGSGDSGGFFSTIASGILSGIGASSRARSDKEQLRQQREIAEMEIRSREGLARIAGDEDRRTIDFETRLNEANRLNERARLGKAWDAWGKGDNSKPAAQPVIAPNFQDYYQKPEPEPLNTNRGK